jgi:hypothetical protein
MDLSTVVLGRLKAPGHRWVKSTEGFDEHAPRVWEKYDWSCHGFVAVLQNMILNEAASGTMQLSCEMEADAPSRFDLGYRK